MREVSVKVELVGGRCILLEDLTMAGITAPKGFSFDGVSKPGWAFWIDRFGKYLPAAAIHECCIERFGYSEARKRCRIALAEMMVSGFELFYMTTAVSSRDWYRRNFENVK